MPAVFTQHLLTIFSRNVSAVGTAAISVGRVQGGWPDALNAMPSQWIGSGTIRAFTRAVRSLLATRSREFAEPAARSQDASAGTELWWNAVPLVDPEPRAEIAASAARRAFGPAQGDENTVPVTGGGDFASTMYAKPGAFTLPGDGAPQDGPVHALHTPLYDPNDAALKPGVAYRVALAQQESAG